MGILTNRFSDTSESTDVYIGTLKFLHTVSVSSSDSLVIGFRCINEINC